MQPAVPEPDDGPWMSADDAVGFEVGEFEQGNALSRWALARYLVGRAIGESVGNTLLIVAAVLIALAVVSSWVLHSTFLAVVAVILAVLTLLLRAGLRAILRSLTATDRFGPIEHRLRAVVSDTRGDVLRELRRCGLPSHAITLPLLAIRLIGKRRRQTLERLRAFDIDNAVPKARVDELHMVLREAFGGPGRVDP